MWLQPTLTHFSHRSAPAQLQVQIATRLVTKVDKPNLILDDTITWDCDMSIIPRRNSTPMNYQQVPFSDTDQLSTLDLPVLTEEHRTDMLILATGQYAILRGNITLTATREFELRKAY